MKQVDLLRRIIRTPNIFATEDQRRIAKRNFELKASRRDKKKLKNQTEFEWPEINHYGHEEF